MSSRNYVDNTRDVVERDCVGWETTDEKGVLD